MKIWVKFLSLFLVLVTLATVFASCLPESLTKPIAPITINPGANKPGNGATGGGANNGGNNGNHVGGVVVGNATAPYIGDVHVSAGVTPDENNQVPSEGVSLESSTASATIPGGVQMEEGTTELSLTINGIKDSAADVTLSDSEVSSSLDVHVSGVAAGNLVPMEVKLLAAALKGLNSTSITLYHVENGETIAMTYVPNDEPFTAHNQFKYDPATGDVILYIASFSEIMMVSDTENVWEGEFDYSWYNASKTELYIANADQLAAFGAIVGGMKKVTGRVEGKYTYSDEIIQDSFTGKTITLLADINLGDKESENNPNLIFYPIGYYNSEGTYERTNTAITSGLRNFEGTFDGNGHTIANFYHNTWEMKGDNNYYDAALQYYRDGMGLFGRLYKATVKNLTVKNFSSDGEYTTTGVIAAYADGATFENISIFNCNPRVYNIGNGGIVGCVGWYAKEANLKTTFTNITVDNSNKISALWGSYDVACGGIVGQYYPTSGQTSAGTPKNAGISFENCHVSAIMDVYNDVCANYQYYAYRYTGMLIGSVRENETIDGRVYPKMEGIEAYGCTVHFGTWNDYYYCEIIDNTTASYTHDYQMSRLTEIKAIDGTTITYLDGTTGTVPASGRANYVIVDYTKGHGTENATCYHFKDGAVWTHDMGGIQTGIDENGDGQDDLKEDKQHIYLEFNNLVTGYGWGVTTKYVGDLAGVAILDRKVGDSIDKFVGTTDENALKPLTGSTINIGTLFSAKEGIEVALNPATIIVSVTPLGENSTVRAAYAINESNWTLGTLALSGVGLARVTITDYYFCKSTSVIIDVQPVDKFAKKFTNTNFTYRVGNQNTIALGSLFGELANLTVPVDSESVEISISGTTNYTFTSNTSDWTKATLNFKNYVGNATITIKDATAKECSVTVEVINATNEIGASNATSNNVVLLNDCKFNSLEVKGGYTLFGNGFIMTCENDSAALNTGYAFVTIENGTLDNVQIVCPNFDYAVLYDKNMKSEDNRSQTENGTTRYYNVKSAVEISGNCQILNSRISGGRAAVNVVSGNCVIDNSRLEGGAVASLLIGSANSVVLRDVTLIQEPTPSTYNPEKKLMGFSVLFICDADGNAAPITLEGTLIQNAWVNESYKQYVPSEGSSVVSLVLGKTEYLHDIDGDGTNESANLGFAFIPEEQFGTINATQIANSDNRTNKIAIPYEVTEITAGVGGASFASVYSYKNTNGTNNSFKTTSDYIPNKYSDVVEVIYSDTTDGLTTSKSFGTSGWIYDLSVDLDKLNGYSIDFSKLAISVNGITTSNYLVNGNTKPTSSIAVTAGSTTYELTTTLNNKEYVVTFRVTGTETSKDAPTINFAGANDGFGVANSHGGDWSAAAPVLEGIIVRYWSVANKDYVNLDLGTIEIVGNAGKLSGNTYWEYTDPNGDYTLKVTNSKAIHDGKSVYGMPVKGADGNLYFTISATNGFVGSGTSSRAITMKFEFRDNNGRVLLDGAGKEGVEHTWNIPYSKDNQYNYSNLISSGALNILKASSTPGTCLAAGTLITLADGSKKAVEDLRKGDLVMSYDHLTGEIVYKDVIIVVRTHSDLYYKNTFVFDDGTELVTINEHGIYDLDLNKYVNIDHNNYADYLGHRFVSVDTNGNIGIKTLVDVTTVCESGYKYDIVTNGTLNYVAEDTLSVTHVLVDVINSFDFDENMMYDQAKMLADIEKYGLYDFDEWDEYCDYSVFEQYNIPVMKVGISKGLYTKEYIIGLINTYVLDDSVQIID